MHTRRVLCFVLGCNYAKPEQEKSIQTNKYDVPSLQQRWHFSAYFFFDMRWRPLGDCGLGFPIKLSEKTELLAFQGIRIHLICLWFGRFNSSERGPWSLPALLWLFVFDPQKKKTKVIREENQKRVDPGPGTGPGTGPVFFRISWQLIRRVYNNRSRRLCMWMMEEEGGLLFCVGGCGRNPQTRALIGSIHCQCFPQTFLIRQCKQNGCVCGLAIPPSYPPTQCHSQSRPVIAHLLMWTLSAFV